jgi:hypothetical protein
VVAAATGTYTVLLEFHNYIFPLNRGAKFSDIPPFVDFFPLTLINF